ncbi:YjbF family lipoprotein [Rheinheimera sp. WS51]|uniref:YjbF family lipoprotein n=1 Tax=Rheinheimera sp. WS51 TaxID=3425886 RepID=UPI003D930097
MALLKWLAVATVTLSLTSCAGTYRAYKDTLQYAFTEQPDASLTLAEVVNSKFDYLYVKHGERPQSVLALMFLEQNQLKWISADQAMLIMEHGRIVRTLGFSNDLLVLSAAAVDPLANIESIDDNTQWQRQLDWAGGEYGYSVTSRFVVEPGHSLRLFDQDIAVTKVIEHLDYASPSNYLRFDQHWQNVFWFDAKSGLLLQSQQQLAPFTEPMQLTFISRVARQLAKTVTMPVAVTKPMPEPVFKPTLEALAE